MARGSLLGKWLQLCTLLKQAVDYAQLAPAFQGQRLQSKPKPALSREDCGPLPCPVQALRCGTLFSNCSHECVLFQHLAASTLLPPKEASRLDPCRPAHCPHPHNHHRVGLSQAHSYFTVFGSSVVPSAYIFSPTKGLHFH